MKKCLGMVVLLLGVCVAYGQDPDDGLPVAARFAFGNLTIQQLTQTSNPLFELKTFFADVKLPLSKEQQRQLPSIFDTYQRQIEIAEGASSNPTLLETKRKLNQEYMKRVNDVLSPEQQSAWRHYRVEQIRLRGGYPALKSILEQAGVPLVVEQEKSIRQVFENFDKRRLQAMETNASPSTPDMDRLAIAELNRVVGLLTSDQRQALQASRRASSSIASRR